MMGEQQIVANIANIIARDNRKYDQFYKVADITLHCTSDMGAFVTLEIYDGHVVRYQVKGTRASWTCTYETAEKKVIRKPRSARLYSSDWCDVNMADVLRLADEIRESLKEEEEEEETVPEITVETRWNSSDVRSICIREGWYTCGDCAEYDHMLHMVETLQPTPENLYKVSKDIMDHSNMGADPEVLMNIMFILDRETVHRFYEVAGE